MINGRTKGHQYEREIVIKFKKYFPLAQRLLEYQEGFGYDIKNTGKLRIQCKRKKNYEPLNTLETVPRADSIPCLVTKADRKEDIICMYLDDFLKIIEDIGIIYEEGK